MSTAAQSAPNTPDVPAKRPILPLVGLFLVLVVTFGGLFVWRFVFKNTILVPLLQQEASPSPEIKVANNQVPDGPVYGFWGQIAEVKEDGNVKTLRVVSDTNGEYKVGVDEGTLVKAVQVQATSSGRVRRLPLSELAVGVRVYVGTWNIDVFSKKEFSEEEVAAIEIQK